MSRSPLRVTFAVRAFPVTSETFILRQITGLMDLGHSVRILAEWRPPSEVVHGVVRDYGLEDRVTYVHEGAAQATRTVLSLASRRPLCLTLLGRQRAAPYGGRRSVLDRLRSLLDVPTDVLHSHFGDVGLRYAEPARCLRIPHVVSYYGYDVTRFPRERGSDVYGPLFQSVDRVTVLSENMRERIEALGCQGAKIRKQHLGVDPSEYEYRDRVPPPSGEPVRVLTVARLVEKKGVEYALRAIADVRAAGGPGAKVEYDIIGEGPLRADLETLTSKLGLDGCVRFRGSQDQETVRRAMMDAHVFLLPSVTAADGDEEGTPTVLLEASSTGLPVISTLHSGIPETVLDGETGFLVPERDVDALASALSSLLHAPEKWQVLGRRGRRHVEAGFDTKTLSGALVQHYREVLARSGRDLPGGVGSEG